VFNQCLQTHTHTHTHTHTLSHGRPHPVRTLVPSSSTHHAQPGLPSTPFASWHAARVGHSNHTIFPPATLAEEIQIPTSAFPADVASFKAHILAPSPWRGQEGHGERERVSGEGAGVEKISSGRVLGGGEEGGRGGEGTGGGSLVRSNISSGRVQGRQGSDRNVGKSMSSSWLSQASSVAQFLFIGCFAFGGYIIFAVCVQPLPPPALFFFKKIAKFPPSSPG
jgi:hypothetical protein